MARVLVILEAKARCRFLRVADAFRLLDIDKSGLIDKSEMREFFDQFNLKQESADLFFDHLKENENDNEIKYAQFMYHFGPVISPGSDNNRQGGRHMYENSVHALGWLRKLG